MSSLFTANSLRLVNVVWHASTTPVHGRDCQNTGLVVGDHAVELRLYIYPRKNIYNDLLGSATISRFWFCLYGRVELVSAHGLTHSR